VLDTATNDRCVFSISIFRIWGLGGAVQKCGDHSGPKFLLLLVEHTQTQIPEHRHMLRLPVFFRTYIFGYIRNVRKILDVCYIWQLLWAGNCGVDSGIICLG